MSDLKRNPLQESIHIYKFDYSGLSIASVKGGAKDYQYVRLPHDNGEETFAGAPPVVRFPAEANTPRENGREIN
jgi:hypothetical protein